MISGVRWGEKRNCEFRNQIGGWGVGRTVFFFSSDDSCQKLVCAQLCPTLCNPIAWSQNTGVGCHFLQGIFPTQGLNLGLLHLLIGREILYH